MEKPIPMRVYRCTHDRKQHSPNYGKVPKGRSPLKIALEAYRVLISRANVHMKLVVAVADKLNQISKECHIA